MPHGVDPAFRPADESLRREIRAEFGAPDGYLLAVGTLEPRKNLALLLDAWEQLRRERDQGVPPLILVGPEGWQDRRLHHRIARLNDAGVRHLGRVDRATLVRAYQGSLGLVYPSLYEGFGLPVAEALACGRPVVVAADTSPAEVAAGACLTFDRESIEELSAAIERLIETADDPACEARALRRAERYQWPAAAAEMERILLAAIEGNR